MMFKLFGFAAVVSFTIAFITGLSVMVSSASDSEGTCPNHPCAGFSYQVLYDEETGKIEGILSWDPANSALGKLGSG